MRSNLTIVAPLCALCVGLFCLVWMALFSGIPLNYDSAILLDFGRLILHGKVPYVDYVDINPPITHYLHAIPVFLAESLGTDTTSTFQALVVLLAVCSSAALARLFGNAPYHFSPPARLFAAAGWLAFSVLSFPIGGFGQREHLFILTYAPWLVCREMRHGDGDIPSTYALLLGLVFGPFALMKPQFLGIAAVLEICLLLRSRSLRPLFAVEMLTVVGCIFLYAVHFLFVPSSMTDALFHRWIPFAGKHYWVYDCSFDSLLAAGFPKDFCIPSMAVLGLGLIVSARKIQAQALAMHMTLCGIGTLLALGCFLVLHKCWNYQLLPAYAFLGLAAICSPAILKLRLGGETRLTGVPSRGLRIFLVTSCLAMVAADVVLTRQGFVNGRAARTSVDAWNAFILEQSHPSDKITFVSTSTGPAYPTLIYTGRFPGTRYVHCWPIAMLYAGVLPQADSGALYRTDSNRTPEEMRFLTELGQDVAVQKPALIAIEDTTSCQACPKGFRVNKYLEVIGWKKAYLSDYCFLTRFREFAVYKRIRNPGSARRAL